MIMLDAVGSRVRLMILLGAAASHRARPLMLAEAAVLLLPAVVEVVLQTTVASRNASLAGTEQPKSITSS